MALAVDQLSLGQIGTNCYLVRADRGATEAVVDRSGRRRRRDPARLARLGRDLRRDPAHAQPLRPLRRARRPRRGNGRPGLAARGRARRLPPAERLLPRLSRSRAYTGEATLLAGGETIEAAGISFQVRHVPGHSPGHVSYYADGCLFSGDVLFAGSVGRTDLPFGDWDTLLESIRSLAEAYPPETIVYSGHGPATTLGDELARNPFLAELRA